MPQYGYNRSKGWTRSEKVVRKRGMRRTENRGRQSKMCRNIRTLFNFEPPVTEEEIHAASLQFVRKISGFNNPSKANEAAFYAAVDDIARISGRLLGELESSAAP